MEKALVFVLLLDVVCDSLRVSVSENYHKALLPGSWDAAELRTGDVPEVLSEFSFVAAVHSPTSALPVTQECLLRPLPALSAG